MVTAPKLTLEGVVSRVDEPAIPCGAPHPAMRIMKVAIAAKSQVAGTAVTFLKLLLRCRTFWKWPGTVKVQAGVFEFAGEEKNTKNLTCQSHPFLMCCVSQVRPHRHRSGVDEHG